jgi:hypothetical protein
VSTLFVLDNAAGGVTLMPVLDSSAAGDAPEGPVETGGGGLAKESSTLGSVLDDLDAKLARLVRDLGTAVS